MLFSLRCYGDGLWQNVGPFLVQMVLSSCLFNKLFNISERGTGMAYLQMRLLDIVGEGMDELVLSFSPRKTGA